MKARSASWRVSFGVAAALAAGAAARTAHAQPREEAVDDPKMARRLGTRIFWNEGPAPRAPVAPPPAPVMAAPAPLATATAAPEGSAADATVYASRAAPEPAPGYSRPRLKLAFRRFDFVRVGAAGSGSGGVASEPFNSLSVDVYPLSSLIRLGLSTQYGWQSGAGLSGGDYFAIESASLGVQIRAGRVVPFAETFAGIGYMRRLQFDRSVPTAYWQLGVDLGAEIFLARTGYVSVALGYLRPVNGFAQQLQFGSVFVDTWSFKLGVGI